MTIAAKVSAVEEVTVFDRFCTTFLETDCGEGHLNVGFYSGFVFEKQTASLTDEHRLSLCSYHRLAFQQTSLRLKFHSEPSYYL